MQHEEHYLTAETPAGRDAIAAVMERSYAADVDEVPPEWALVRLADGVPVSFLLLDPDRAMEFPRGDLRYAFICDVATREDRRHEGHFRAIMAEAYSRLRAAGITMVALHGEWALYRPFGFARFTHHSGVFLSPDLIRRELGVGPTGAPDLLTLLTHGVRPDLLVVTRVRAETAAECLLALRQAATAAESAGKSRILFEEPDAPGYGSRYRPHASLMTPFTEVACQLGGQHVICGDDPESGPVPHADSIRALSSVGLLRQVLPLLAPEAPLPDASVAFDEDAGVATLSCQHGDLSVGEGAMAGATRVRWPSGSLAQLVTGYRSAALLSALHGSALPAPALALLETVFPPCWRLTRNENWTYQK